MKNSSYLVHQIFILLLISVLDIAADYCESGICEGDKYCCGDNRCCARSSHLWLLWAGILLVIFSIAIAVAIRRYRNNSSRLYSRLPVMERVLIT